MEKFIKENSPKLVLLGLVVVGIFCYVYFSKNTNIKKGPEALAIEKVGLAEFNAENDTINDVSSQDKKIAKEMTVVFEKMGDGKDNGKNKEVINLLNGIIKKYPKYSEVYFMRATMSVLVNDTNYSNILSDIDNAIKFHLSNSSNSVASMYGLKAKVDILSENYQQAINNLETAMTTDFSNIVDAFNTGGIKPDDESNITALQRKDFDLLITKYPNDYRVYIDRGLFFESFSFYDEQYYAPAIKDFKKAIELNKNSALAQYFMGKLAEKNAMFSKAAWSDVSNMVGNGGGYRDQINTIALSYFKKSIELDPKLKDAYAQVAQIFSSLRKYSEAIQYYDKVIELDPNDAGAINDRGLSKVSNNDYYSAISDFTDAISLKKKGSFSYLDATYENRANAYIKTNNYDSAIEDYSHAIGLKFGKQLILMSLGQIRTLYPEFSNITDQNLLEGLRQKYFSNMSTVDFTENTIHDSIDKKEEKKPYKEFMLGDLYTNRGDAYILKGDFKNASKDYARAVYEGSTTIIDRWRVLSKTAETEYYIDAQTIDFSQGNIVSLWIKTVNVSSGNYDQSKYQVDCVGDKLKLVSSTSYDSLGNPINIVSEQGWQIVTPDSVGEIWYKGACSK